MAQVSESDHYVMRILQDMDAPDNLFKASDHVERWIKSFTCDDGMRSTEDVEEAATFPSREAAREFWLTQCPLGKPWDFIDGQTAPIDYDAMDDDEVSQPLTRYTVMIEHHDEARAIDRERRATHGDG
jgi:hypothetical protein